MQTVTLDFETFYGREYSLSKLTTEEYIRDNRFEVIGFAVQIEDGRPAWFTGDHDYLAARLEGLDWDNTALLGHNTAFDGAILSWRFDIHPRVLLDTMSMARPIVGPTQSVSLANLARYFGLGEKGDEVVHAIDKRRADFARDELARYGEYCRNDVALTYKLYTKMLGLGFPMEELKLIDLTLKMFTEPTLQLNPGKLAAHLTALRLEKRDLLVSCMKSAGRKDLAALVAMDDEDGKVQAQKLLRSDAQFAELLEGLGVTAPTKISPKTGKVGYAFAKTDAAFKEIVEHEDPAVQALAAARLGTKTTIEESRTERFMGIAHRGSFPVPLKYYAAHSGRWGGSDSVNLQNLASRGKHAKKLKRAIEPPPGYVILDCDSSQIEARVVAWLAGQEDLVQAFRDKEDVYSQMASRIYRRTVDRKRVEIDENGKEFKPDEREGQVGKTVVLGCLSEKTLVLCERGWVPITKIKLTDRLWDGEEWVCHKGLLHQGLKKTQNLCGLWLTPDHRVLCGTNWLESHSVALDRNALCRALERGAENLPLQATSPEFVTESQQSSLRVIAGTLNTLWRRAISRLLSLRGAPYALTAPAARNSIGRTQSQCLTTVTANGSLTACPPPSPAATTKPTRSTTTTGTAESMFMRNGVTTALRSFVTSRLCPDGIYRSLKWTALTITDLTLRGISSLSPRARTCLTGVVWSSRVRKLQTYDIACAGPRNRFTVATAAGPLIVHNCGYGMGGARFRDQLRAQTGIVLPLEETTRIVKVYREAAPMIPKLWKDFQAALDAALNGAVTYLGPNNLIRVDAKGVRLPNGLYIQYPNLQYTVNEEGKKEMVYQARNGYTRIYGAKVVENVCQALARLIVGYQMLKVSRRYRVVLTVHDSVLAIAKIEEAEIAKAYIEKCMRMTPSWAEGLPIDCEGGYGPSYGDC